MMFEPAVKTHFTRNLLVTLCSALLLTNISASQSPPADVNTVLNFSAQAQGMANRPASVRLQGRLTDAEGNERAFEMIAAARVTSPIFPERITSTPTQEMAIQPLPR
jgi:hypothetical protein